MKTIKQIADELGVPKDNIKYRVRNLQKTHPQFVEKQKNGNEILILISDEGIEILKKMLVGNLPGKLGNSPGKAGNLPGEYPDKSGESLSESETKILNLIEGNLELLKNQIEEKDRQLSEKDRQLSEKDKQIEKLTETVKAQAQSINADRHNELAGTLREQITDNTNQQPNVFKRIIAAIKGKE